MTKKPCKYYKKEIEKRYTIVLYRTTNILENNAIAATFTIVDFAQVEYLQPPYCVNLFLAFTIILLCIIFHTLIFYNSYSTTL